MDDSLQQHTTLAQAWGTFVFAGIFTLFQLWMFIDALRKREWVWAVFIMAGWGLSAIIYYLSVYRLTSGTSGFELPGTFDRKRIKEIQAKIHHLDNAVHHYQLGDVYFRKGKMEKAEACYREALKRDPEDIDAQAHLGQCLLRLKRPEDALPFLQKVCTKDTEHEHGYSLMAYAEALSAIGKKEDAMKVWQHVVSHHSYPRAKFQLAELYVAANQFDPARQELLDLLADDLHAPPFQRRRDRPWISRAKSLYKKIEKSRAA